MTYYLRSSEARISARSNLTIFDEVNSLMRQVMVAADAGAYELTVSDGTTMTESTPTVTVTGTVANPTTTSTTLIFNGTTVNLGTTGFNLNSVIADINDAGVTGIVASKSSDNKLVITYTCTQADWSLEIGSGTGNTDLGLTAATYTATSPTSTDYYSVWQGTTEDRAKTDEMTRVETYFENLGYNISRVKNTTTSSTFSWKIYW